MDIKGMKVDTGYAVYVKTEEFEKSGTTEEKLILKAIFNDFEEAQLYMRDLAEQRYDDPLEYSRDILNSGKTILFRAVDYRTGKCYARTWIYIEEYPIFK